MAWFKKIDDGDSDMINANTNGRTGAQEPAAGRAEPREPRIEPRTASPRTSEPRAQEPRAAAGSACPGERGARFGVGSHLAI